MARSRYHYRNKGVQAIGSIWASDNQRYVLAGWETEQFKWKFVAVNVETGGVWIAPTNRAYTATVGLTLVEAGKKGNTCQLNTTT